MHCENFNAFSCNFACSAGLGGLPPLGESFAQALLAAWNCADRGLTPVTWPLRSLLRTSTWPSLGSGNSGTPCVRMQCENATIFCWALALLSLSGEEELPPPGSVPLEVLEPRCATPGLEEEPPQPATSRDGASKHGQGKNGSRHISVSFTVR